MPENDHVAFIGLGAMGYPMAGHLQASGRKVTVYNRTAERAEAWCRQYGGEMASTPAAAVQGASIVFLCVGNDSDVMAVVTGDDGVLSSMKTGATLVDHTTTSRQLAQELEKLSQKQDIAFLDAPVSGGQAGAENGALTVMVGGADTDLKHVQSAIDCYSRHTQLMGPVGHGQLTKMVNQLCIAGVLGGLAEAYHFAESAGLDIKAVAKAIQGGAAQSWQMNNRSETIADGHYDFGFAIDWMRKDLGFALDVAQELGLHLEIAHLVDSQYSTVQALGGNRWDTSGLIEAIRQRTRDLADKGDRVTHSGGCHCGDVQWSIEAPLVLDTHTCNCSICNINHYQHFIVPKSRFHLNSDPELIACYRFGSEIAEHYFCRRCGVKSYYVPRSNPDGVSVNVRCITSDTVKAIYDTPFDGHNWEKNAGSLAHLSKA